MNLLCFARGHSIVTDGSVTRGSRAPPRYTLPAFLNFRAQNIYRPPRWRVVSVNTSGRKIDLQK